jgi:hypothetical protein
MYLNPFLLESMPDNPLFSYTSGRQVLYNEHMFHSTFPYVASYHVGHGRVDTLAKIGIQSRTPVGHGRWVQSHRRDSVLEHSSKDL